MSFSLSDRVSVFLLTSVLATFALRCNGATPADDVGDTSQEELRVDSSDIVGDITYDSQTGWIDVPAGRTYRALRVHAKAGDTLRVSVWGASGVPKAWILSPTHRTLAYSGVDEARTDKSRAGVEATVPADGEYVVAFREREKNATQIRVTLGLPYGDRYCCCASAAPFVGSDGTVKCYYDSSTDGVCTNPLPANVSLDEQCKMAVKGPYWRWFDADLAVSRNYPR